MYNLLDSNLFECHWHVSKRLYYLFLILYGVALLIVFQLPMVFGWQILIAVILSIYVIRVLRKHILFILPTSFTALRRTSNNWLVYNQQIGWQVIKLLSSESVVLSGVIILQFSIEGDRKRLSLCLPFDVMLESDYRKLKVYLRYLTE
ncbi:hypothetical protein MTZ49_00095 [Entomomonas sp. E2T0]|uniref:protein YgfX n=1 Tax=Entomomonas sp. E2T0 TaxID=2930213 RepID=UPI002228362D|nr:protein YgfX [Entomomonas sp. E2T0]UYZ84030.1 hypothetical protein MTZ49_00095 [Entomomonas sp. E2T0]